MSTVVLYKMYVSRTVLLYACCTSRFSDTRLATLDQGYCFHAASRPGEIDTTKLANSPKRTVLDGAAVDGREPPQGYSCLFVLFVSFQLNPMNDTPSTVRGNYKSIIQHISYVPASRHSNCEAYPRLRSGVASEQYVRP